MCPELVGGSADLTGSNLTNLKVVGVVVIVDDDDDDVIIIIIVVVVVSVQAISRNQLQLADTFASE